MLWNHAAHTCRGVTANRPDIIIKNQKEKTCILIGMAIPTGRNVMQKEAEKKLKYKILCIKIQRMQNLKCVIIPVIFAATGIATKCLRKYLKDLPGKYSINSLQKTAVLGTSHIIWKILQSETLKPERWGSSLVLKKYQEEKVCDRQQHHQQQQQ